MITADAGLGRARRARVPRAIRSRAAAAIVGETRLRDNEVNYSRRSILQATASLGDGSDAGIFISMRPQQARLLLPQLKIASVSRTGFATSHIYAGDANPGSTAISTASNSATRRGCSARCPGARTAIASRAQLASANGVGARLFAFGMDAYALLPYLDWLLAHPDAYLDGATGDLAPTVSDASIGSSAGRASATASRGLSNGALERAAAARNERSARTPPAARTTRTRAPPARATRMSRWRISSAPGSR